MKLHLLLTAVLHGSKYIAIAALAPVKEPPVPIRQDAGWALEPVRMRWRRQISWPCKNRTPVALLTQILCLVAAGSTVRTNNI
jgi:hypothetical protein